MSINTENFELISLTTESKIVTITIERSKQLNALNRQVLEELKKAFQTLNQSLKEVDGVIIVGSGDKAFIAGADIKEMSEMNVEEAKNFGALGQEVTFLIENFERPVIACVNGFALGGGCEMAMSCDFILATQNAVFGQPEVKLGLIPGFGGTQRLSKIIGRNKAKEIIYTGRNLKSDEALNLGLVLKILETKEDLMNEGKAILTSIGRNSLLAVKEAKNVINNGVDCNNNEGLELELESFAKVFCSKDFKEGTTAFIEKRKPEFIGE